MQHEYGILFPSSKRQDRRVGEKIHSFEGVITFCHRTNTSDEWISAKMVSHEEALQYDAMTAMILKRF